MDNLLCSGPKEQVACNLTIIFWSMDQDVGCWGHNGPGKVLSDGLFTKTNMDLLTIGTPVLE